MRVGADFWRRNAETVGAGRHHGLVREHAAEDPPVRVYRMLRAWGKLMLTETIVPTGDSGIRRTSVSE